MGSRVQKRTRVSVGQCLVFTVPAGEKSRLFAPADRDSDTCPPSDWYLKKESVLQMKNLHCCGF